MFPVSERLTKVSGVFAPEPFSSNDIVKRFLGMSYLMAPRKANIIN